MWRGRPRPRTPTDNGVHKDARFKMADCHEKIVMMLTSAGRSRASLGSAEPDRDNVSSPAAARDCSPPG